MNGEWLLPLEPKHKCDLPKIEFSRMAGGRWKCDCGQIYVIAQVWQHGESWKQWTREETK